MNAILKRFFFIRPGEGKKALLLLLLHSLFYLGLMWGGFAREALFINTWGAQTLDVIFIANAVLAFTMGLLYTFFADRINNERLLIFFIGCMVIWLGSVWIWIQLNGDKQSLVYPYFYLVYGAVSDLGTMLILNYINDFYNTRSAKHAIPLMLAGAVAGSTVAGFTFITLRSWLGLENIPLAWIGILVITLVMIYVISQALSAERLELYKAIQVRQDTGPQRKASFIDNLTSGFNYIRQSGMLRWLALATFLMVILMNILIYQTSFVFQERYANNPNGLSDFYALVDGFSSLGTLLIQSLALGRLINAFGVGTMNLFFPIFTLLSVGLLSIMPGNFPAAIVGRVDTRGIKQSFRNPLDALLYNSIPVHIKARSKGFINGLVVPLGSLVAGLLLLSMRTGLARIIPGLAIIIGAIIGIAYLISIIRVRTEYRHSLTTLLADDDTQIFQLSEEGFDQADPGTLNVIRQRINNSQNDTLTIFLTELLYKLAGKEVIPYLLELATKGTPAVRASLLNMLGTDWVSLPEVQKACLAGLSDNDVIVRRASAVAITSDPNILHNDDLLITLLNTLVDDDDEEVQAALIPALFASGDFYYLAPAVQILGNWLNDQKNEHRRALGLRVLGKTSQERLLRTLIRFIRDDSPVVRLQAIQLVGKVMSDNPQVAKDSAVVTLHAMALGDDNNAVQAAAVKGLVQIGSLEASRILLPILETANFTLRRQICETIQQIPIKELEEALQSENPDMVESAAYILAAAKQPNAKRKLIEIAENHVSDIYRLLAHSLALSDLDLPAGTLLNKTIQELSETKLDRIFWLLGALSSGIDSQAIRKGMESNTLITRANAAETIEALTSSQFLYLIRPLFMATTPEDTVHLGIQKMDLRVPDLNLTLCETWPDLVGVIPELKKKPREGLSTLYSDGWITAVTMYAIWEKTSHGDKILDKEHLKQALQSTLEKSSLPLVVQTARSILSRIDDKNVPEKMEDTMLDIIEKVIFLKEIPFFEGMQIEQLRTIASISEETAFKKGDTIIAQNSLDTALYIIIKGKAAVQRQRIGVDVNIARLTELGPREYFGETSIFDNQPSSVEVVALENIRLLQIRQDLLMALIQQYPGIAFDLLKGLSLRLRQSEEIITHKSKSRGKKLLEYFDSIEESNEEKTDKRKNPLDLI